MWRKAFKTDSREKKWINFLLVEGKPLLAKHIWKIMDALHITDRQSQIFYVNNVTVTIPLKPIPQLQFRMEMVTYMFL